MNSQSKRQFFWGEDEIMRFSLTYIDLWRLCWLPLTTNLDLPQCSTSFSWPTCFFWLTLTPFPLTYFFDPLSPLWHYSSRKDEERRKMNRKGAYRANSAIIMSKLKVMKYPIKDRFRLIKTCPVCDHVLKHNHLCVKTITGRQERRKRKQRSGYH